MALLAGVEHFATAVDSTVSAPGFVPGETAAAVILQVRASANAKQLCAKLSAACFLQALNDSLASADGAVVVRPPVRPWVDAAWLSQLAAECDGDSTDQRRSSSVSGSDLPLSDAEAALTVLQQVTRWDDAPRAHVKDIIRALNFHVLSLLRPESLLLSATVLPPAYKQEYVLRQVRAVC